VRRKFEHAAQIAPRAQYAIDQTALLYALEASLKSQRAAPEDIRATRQAQAYPILRRLEEWMRQTYAKCTPKSPLGKAIAYAHGVWIRIARYVPDGHYEIDNNAIERQIRPLTLGRKTASLVGTTEAQRTTPSSTA